MSKKKYIVVQKGCCLKGTEETKIGTTVSLTDEQAANKVGKVRLLDEHKAEQIDADSEKKVTAQAKQIKAHEATIADQAKQIEGLMAEVAKKGK